MIISKLTLTVAFAAAAIPLAASAQMYGHGMVHSDRGVIASVNGTNVRLEDGRTIFLHNGTVINPTGITLRAGQRISVMGSRGGRGAINANEIDVMGRHHYHR